MNEDSLWDLSREHKRKPLFGYSKNPITPFLAVVAQFPEMITRNPTPIQTIRTGLNKICPVCKHKMKKCTCKNGK